MHFKVTSITIFKHRKKKYDHNELKNKKFQPRNRTI